MRCFNSFLQFVKNETNYNPHITLRTLLDRIEKMKAFEIPFCEVMVALRQPNSKAEIMKHSPAGKVPALLINDLLVWDSLAIIDCLADHHPDLAIGPRDSRIKLHQIEYLMNGQSAETDAGLVKMDSSARPYRLLRVWPRAGARPGPERLSSPTGCGPIPTQRLQVQRGRQTTARAARLSWRCFERRLPRPT